MMRLAMIFSSFWELLEWRVQQIRSVAATKDDCYQSAFATS
jgi:hypothetical protein